MKKKVLLSSIATIALCFCLIAGSTFALFTSTSDFEITVTSGDVEIEATAGISGVFSAAGTDGAAADKYLRDEENNNYLHVAQNLVRDDEGKVVKGIFSNGGEAYIDGANLVINRITPGDRVDVDINVRNKSNVAISYRYKIAATDTMLAQGMVVTVDGKSYEALKSWTSEWFTLDAPRGIAEQIAAADAKTISVELPVFATSEYENGKVQYTVTVEAVQNNAVTRNEESVVVYAMVGAINTALANGGEVILDTNFNSPLTIDETANATLNLDGKALNDNVVNKGYVEIEGGMINANPANSNACGFQNNGGNATLTDIVMNAGDENDYCNISYGGTIVYNDVEINSKGGGIGVVSGADIEFNSGTIVINSSSTSQRHIFYAAGEGSTIVVNDGTFAFEPYRQRSYACANGGATIIINGGTFGVAPNHERWKTPIYTDDASSVVIKGGTFGFNPTEWVADGYTVTESNGVWTVSK